MTGDASAPPNDGPVPSDDAPPHPGHRRRTVAIVLAALAVLLVASLVTYQRAGRTRRASEALLRATLDRLVTAQEGFFYDSARYAPSVGALPGFAVPSGVNLEITMPAPRSWSATATHASLAGRHCVVWVGTPPPALPEAAREPKNETRPLCFEDARGER
jgi:hypothetical protein